MRTEHITTEGPLIGYLAVTAAPSASENGRQRIQAVMDEARRRVAANITIARSEQFAAEGSSSGDEGADQQFELVASTVDLRAAKQLEQTMECARRRIR